MSLCCASGRERPGSAQAGCSIVTTAAVDSRRTRHSEVAYSCASAVAGLQSKSARRSPATRGRVSTDGPRHSDRWRGPRSRSAACPTFPTVERLQQFSTPVVHDCLWVPETRSCPPARQLPVACRLLARPTASRSTPSSSKLADRRDQQQRGAACPTLPTVERLKLDPEATNAVMVQRKPRFEPPWPNCRWPLAPDAKKPRPAPPSEIGVSISCARSAVRNRDSPRTARCISISRRARSEGVVQRPAAARSG